MEVAAEDRAIRHIEKAYMTRDRNTLYVACEDYDFTWSRVEMAAFRQMWREGTPLLKIAIALRRHINEVAILVIDQAERDYIKPREGGVFGMISEVNLPPRKDEYIEEFNS